MSLAPVEISGSVQTMALNRRGSDGSTESSIQQVAGINLESYFWQPWFARVSGSADVAYEKTFGDESGTALRSSGNVSLSVLPLSRYPVTLSLSHIDNRVSGDFTSSNSIRDRASISARAAFTQTLRGGLRASWDRADRDDSGLLNARNIDLDVSKTFSKEDAFLGINFVSFGAGLRESSFEADDPEDEDRDRLAVLLRLNVRSEPFEDVTYDSLYTATYDTESEDSDDFTRLALQGVSTAQWRPSNKPYIVTGTWRTLTEQITRDEDGGPSDSNTLLAAGTVGLRWPVSDRFSFNLGLRGSYEDISRDAGDAVGEDGRSAGTGVNATFLAGANYNSEKHAVSGFDWRWNGRVSTEDGLRSDEGLISNSSVGLGHRFERMLKDVIFIPVRFSFAQDGSMRFDSQGDDPFVAGLSNSVAFDYNSTGAASATFARLFLRDSRDLIGDSDEFQLVQFRLGRRVAINRDRRIQGDLTGQAAREVTDGDADVSATVSGRISYNHRNIFGVENLGFRSELRVNIVDFEQLFGESEDEVDSDLFRNDLRNVLTYRIGRLSAGLEATAFHSDGGLGYLALFRLRRDFGGYE